jgi:hypothetical protein
VSFGQQSGPPASAKQLSYLLSLVKKAGFDGFRDARHPLGLTQRQAGGKFTGKEASALIDRLLGGEADGDEGDLDRARADAHAAQAADALATRQASLVRGMPAEVLVAELELRGWTVEPPSS